MCEASHAPRRPKCHRGEEEPCVIRFDDDRAAVKTSREPPGEIVVEVDREVRPVVSLGFSHEVDPAGGVPLNARRTDASREARGAFARSRRTISPVRAG